MRKPSPFLASLLLLLLSWPLDASAASNVSISCSPENSVLEVFERRSLITLFGGFNVSLDDVTDTLETAYTNLITGTPMCGGLRLLNITVSEDFMDNTTSFNLTFPVLFFLECSGEGCADGIESPFCDVLDVPEEDDGGLFVNGRARRSLVRGESAVKKPRSLAENFQNNPGHTSEDTLNEPKGGVGPLGPLNFNMVPMTPAPSLSLFPSSVPSISSMPSNKPTSSSMPSDTPTFSNMPSESSSPSSAPSEVLNCECALPDEIDFITEYNILAPDDLAINFLTPLEQTNCSTPGNGTDGFEIVFVIIFDTMGLDINDISEADAMLFEQAVLDAINQANVLNPFLCDLQFREVTSVVVEFFEIFGPFDPDSTLLVDLTRRQLRISGDQAGARLTVNGECGLICPSTGDGSQTSRRRLVTEEDENGDLQCFCPVGLDLSDFRFPSEEEIREILDDAIRGLVENDLLDFTVGEVVSLVEAEVQECITNFTDRSEASFGLAIQTINFVSNTPSTAADRVLIRSLIEEAYNLALFESFCDLTYQAVVDVEITTAPAVNPLDPFIPMGDDNSDDFFYNVTVNFFGDSTETTLFANETMRRRMEDTFGMDGYESPFFHSQRNLISSSITSAFASRNLATDDLTCLCPFNAEFGLLTSEDFRLALQMALVAANAVTPGGPDLIDRVAEFEL